MQDLKNFMGVSELMDMISNLIPDGTEVDKEINGVKFKMKKNGAYITINIEEPEETLTKFDDSETKTLVKKFKDNIKALDDDLFVKITEQMGEIFNLCEFNKLLDLKSYDEEQSDLVLDYIDKASDLVCDTLQFKIQELVDLYE